LVAAARQVGVEFWENTEALKLLIDGAPRRVTGVLTGVGELRSQQTVVTAGSWSSLLCRKGKDGASQIEVEPVRGQMVAVEMTVPPLRHVIYSRRGYVIPRLSGVLIAGSTTERAGFDRRVTAGGIASIIERAVEIVPNLARQEVREVWAGLRPHAPDDLPILGADSEINGLVYATGHYRNGILLTPITARLISQLLLGAEPELNLAPFSASRFTASSARV